MEIKKKTKPTRSALLNYKPIVIICDESVKKGKNYSYFYGGCLCNENRYEQISNTLSTFASALNFNELKSTKITPKNYKNYIRVLDLFFTFIKSGELKLRIMFAPNEELLNLKKAENESYSKFYYIFIRHAFSLLYAKENLKLRLIFDDLPETKKVCRKFKRFLVHNLNNLDIPNTNDIFISDKQIEEVDSKKHIILQCVDVILGCIDAFVNEYDSPDTNSSKRFKARFDVFKFIFSKVQEIHPYFQILKTTLPVYNNKGWLDVYKHFIYYNKIKTPDVSTNRPRERVALRKHQR